MLKSEVVEHFKTQTAVADCLGISYPSVSCWGEVIPEKQAMKLERLTDGALKYDASLYMPKHKQTA